MADSSTFQARQTTQEIAVKPRDAFFLIIVSLALIGVGLVIAAAIAGVPMQGYQAPDPQPAPVATPY